MNLVDEEKFDLTVDSKIEMLWSINCTKVNISCVYVINNNYYDKLLNSSN